MEAQQHCCILLRGRMRGCAKGLFLMVGAEGFEPPTLCFQRIDRTITLI